MTCPECKSSIAVDWGWEHAGRAPSVRCCVCGKLSTLNIWADSVTIDGDDEPLPDLKPGASCECDTVLQSERL